MVGDQKFDFHLVPSGLLHPNAQNVIGNGVVVHLPGLFDELDKLSKKGKDPELAAPSFSPADMERSRSPSTADPTRDCGLVALLWFTRRAAPLWFTRPIPVSLWFTRPILATFGVDATQASRAPSPNWPRSIPP